MYHVHNTRKQTQKCKTSSKKTLPDYIQDFACRRDRRPELWVMDEHRLGLKPIVRRVWTLPGQRPTAVVEPRYEWLYVYGFVHPTTGRSFWLVLPTVSIVAFNIALTHFANFVESGTTTEIRLLLDGAGWHKGPKVCWPASVKPFALPPYSPELQPAEHLWHLIDKPVINRHFDNLDELQDVVAERCVWLQDNPDIVKSATNFHWWPQVA